MDEKIITCRDCKRASFHYMRFDNQYVCQKYMDKCGRIPEEDLKGHRANYTCDDSIPKDSEQEVTT